MPEIKLPKPLKHPVIACTPKELARLQKAWKGKGLEHEVIVKLVEKADRAVSAKLVFPPRGGQHNQWYQCEKCQYHLVTLTSVKHQCPRCKKIYSGEPYDDVLFAKTHRRNVSAACNAGWAYAITGDKKYAQLVKQVLMGYAERYLQYPFHDNRCRQGKKASASGGHISEQTLGEASEMASFTAPAYDLVYNSDVLGDADHKAIRTGLFLPMLQCIDRHKAGKSNWQTWHNAAMLKAGAVIGEVKWVRKALAQPGNGFTSQMTTSVTADGMWYENSWGYHFYTLSALVHLAEGARRLDIDLWSHPAFRNMFTLPARYTMANGSLPRFGDDVNSTAKRAVDRMEAAYHAYADPAILAGLPGTPNFYSILYGRTMQGTASHETGQQSQLFPTAGHAIMQSRGRSRLTAAFTYGPFGGFHGHFDKLSFVFFGYGSELSVDPGRARSQAYRLPIHRNWYRASISHNTVVVDKKSQEGTEGKLLYFGANERYAVVGAVCDSAYKGVKHSRWLIMTPNFLVVVDDLKSQTRRRYDWWYHNRGNRIVCAAAGESGKPEKGYVGMEYLQRLKKGTSADMIRACFEQSKVSTQLICAAAPGTDVLTGFGVGASVEERVPALCLTRRGRDARFAVVLEPTRPDRKAGTQEVVLREEKGQLIVEIKGAVGHRITLGTKKHFQVEADGKRVLSTP